MYQTQQALIDHLENAPNAATSPVDGSEEATTIKEYAGEVQNGMKGRIKFPAILILYVDGNPMARLPDYNFELLFIDKNEHHDREASKKNALKFTQAYAEYLRDNQEFQDTDSYYTLSGGGNQRLEEMNMETILNDYKYCILSLPLAVKVERG